VRRNPYDRIPYATWPRLETHPDRLAAVAILMGMEPPDPASCRVLEIGCSDGGNLIPMAYALPAANFTGIDLAASPVQRARRAIRAIGLTNIQIRRADLRDYLRSGGAFDYIISHGLYSWLPPAERDALLAVCRRLTPNGVAFVSYNAYPGRHLRQMLREMMLHHTGGAASAGRARQFLRQLRESVMVSALWRPLLDDEIASMLERDDAGLVHDDLALHNHPVYFHEFAAHASRHGLQYLGDAHVHEMVDHRGELRSLGRDRLAREQYLDYLKLRRFRQSLLCRSEVKLARDLQPGRAARLAFSSPARREGEYREGSNRVRIRADDAAVEAIADKLAAAWPRPVPAAGLGDPGILFTLCTGGFVEPHVLPGPAPVPATEKPLASAVARYQAQSGSFVTNICHRTVELEPALAGLLPYFDGTRTVAELARVAGISARRLRPVIEWLGSMALLAEPHFDRRSN